MNVQIRAARAADASAIARIAREAGLAEIDADSPPLLRLLAGGRTRVAALQGEVVGFADGFLTTGEAGARRYELDLLAVAPAAQGRGLAGLLLAAILAAARSRNPHQIRALVRGGNLRMERLCQRHGFARSKAGYALYVAAPQPAASRRRPHAARLVVVDTLAYAGIWLEGDLSQGAIDDARAVAIEGGMSTIGALIPRRATTARRLLEANGFGKVGVYRWWTINRRNG